MRMRLKYAYTVLSLLLVLLPACDQSDPTESDARITESGVDGVRFGDTPNEVIEKLGTSYTFANTDGSTRAWQTFIYRKGPHAGVKVHFLEVLGVDENGNETLVPGTVDFFTAFDSYQGNTKKGIGIGSTKSDIIQAYGEPIDIRGLSYFYCIGDKDLEIIVQADTVSLIGLGYDKPIGEGGLQFCND